MSDKKQTRKRGEQRPDPELDLIQGVQQEVPDDENAILSGGDWKPGEVKSEPDRELYFGVVTQDSAFSYFTPGARCISRWIGGFKVENGKALFTAKVARGSTFSCTPPELELVQSGIEGFILRPNGMGGADRLSILGRRKPTPEGKLVVRRPYLRMEHDCPLGWFIAIVKIAHKDAIPEWASDEMEIRKRTYFKRPDELLNVDIFAPEEENTTTGYVKTQDEAYQQMNPDPDGPRKVLYSDRSRRKMVNGVMVSEA